MILLVIPFFLKVAMPIFGLTALGGLLLILYHLVLEPVLGIVGNDRTPPPEAGVVFELIVYDQERVRTISVGQLDSDVLTRMEGIREDHLILKFKKDMDQEEYDVTVIPNGAIYYQAPHTKNLELMDGPEEFASNELIGYPAVFRLVAAMTRDFRPTQCIDFELSTKYIIDSSGADKMQFSLELKNIHPGVDVESGNRRGIYRFGQQRQEVYENTAEEQEGEPES